jgi:hypothetical protein
MNRAHEWEGKMYLSDDKKKYIFYDKHFDTYIEFYRKDITFMGGDVAFKQYRKEESGETC